MKLIKFFAFLSALKVRGRLSRGSSAPAKSMPSLKSKASRKDKSFWTPISASWQCIKRINWLTVIAIFGLIGLFVAEILFPRPRVYQVEAVTEYIEIKPITSLVNRWLLKDFTVCIDDAEEFLFNAPSHNKKQLVPSCSSESHISYKEVYLELKKGSTVSLTWSFKHGTQIQIVHPQGFSLEIDGQPLNNLQYPVILSQGNDVLDQQITLPFEGYVILGQSLGVGTEHVLESGHIYAFENTLFTGALFDFIKNNLGLNWGWDERYELNQQTLFMGDVVSFYNENGDEKSIKGMLRVEVNDDGNKRGLYTFISAGIEDSTGLFSNNETKVRTDRLGSDGFNFSPSIWARIENAPDITIVIMIMAALMVLLEIGARIKFVKSNEK